MIKDKDEKEHNGRYSKIDVKRFFRDAILLGLINSVILLALLYYGENNILKVKRSDLEATAQATLQIERNLLGNEFDYVISDIAYLKENFQNLLQTPEGIDQAAKEWVVFSDKRKIYDQIRFLDVEGNEVIRINYLADGAYRIANSNLQNKADRYYFTETIRLNPGQIFISKLDLNMEQGQIEMPYKPMIRICTPAYNDQNVLLGIIVLNYKAENLLRDFKNVENVDLADHYLLNANGYWLSSPDSSQEWAFMFEDKQDISFKNSFPVAWAEIQSNIGAEDSAAFYTENGLFAYVQLRFDEKLVNNRTMIEENRFVVQEGFWTVVIHEREDGENGLAISGSVLDIVMFVLQKYLSIFVIFFAGGFIFTYALSVMRLAKQRLIFFSTYDQMTELYNRRAGMEKLKEKMALQDRRKNPITIMFVDVNGLKQVNDTFGHEFGDELILTAAKVFKEEIRKADFAVRMGGDEFLIGLCGTNAERAENLWQRIVQRFEEINKTEARPYIISASHGIAAFDREKATEMDVLIKKADEAMYAEKVEIKKGLTVIRDKEV